jgi:hypothetical protein
MKKTTFFAAALALGLTVVLTSCGKEEDPDPVKTYGKISGTAFANLDESNNVMEKVPAGTTVIARVNPMEYSDNPDFSVDYEEITYVTEVGSSGNYNFPSIEAYTNSQTVTLIFSDFEYNTILDDQGNDTRNVYSAGDITVSLVADQDRIQDVTFAY